MTNLRRALLQFHYHETAIRSFLEKDGSNQSFDRWIESDSLSCRVTSSTEKWVKKVSNSIRPLLCIRLLRCCSTIVVVQSEGCGSIYT